MNHLIKKDEKYDFPNKEYCGFNNNDRTISIAIGKSRTAKKWENKEIKFSDFVRILQNPTVVPITQEEYQLLPKEKKDEIKDVGGYVGGKLEGNSRKPAKSVRRSLLTLDCDYPPKNFKDLVSETIPYCFIIHSTFSHSSENPRYRLLIPLDREVTADEYPAVGRKIAEMIGIDYFDQSTFKPNGIMYWPARCPHCEHENSEKVMSGGDIVTEVIVVDLERKTMEFEVYG